MQLAKSRGTFTKGVQFVEQAATLNSRQTLFRHPQAGKGEVRPSSAFIHV